MDSSAIVCMADEINANEGGTPVDTVSYYDDSEPNWNERPYFTVVEEKRGRIGHHIDVRNQNEWQPFDDDSLPAWTPAFAGGSSEAHRQFRDCLTARGNRVVLRGIGGDEMLGGVPNPLPELADLLVGCRLGPLAHQLKAWALILRRPWFHLFRDTVRLFLPQSLRGRAPESKPPRWLTSHFAERYQSALLGYCSRIKAFCLPPSFQENLFTLDALRRQLVCSVPPTQPPYEYRYPYLDRDLLEFLFAIPREQLVRPGQRRSLMRRALRGVVPDKILDRKRKAFVSRAPALAIRASLARRQGGREVLFLGSLGFVDEDKFVGEMKKTLSGGDVAVVPLLRALILESWLQSLLERRVIASKQPGGEQLLFVFDDRSQLRKLNERRYES